MKLVEIISLVADIISIVGVSLIAIWGYLKKDKSLTGFKVNYFVSYFLKTALILCVAGLLILALSPLYVFLITILKGNGLPILWESGKEFQHIISYFITAAFGTFLFWLLAPIVWTSSLVYAVELLNIFLPTSKKITTDKFKNERTFQVEKATYRTDNSHSFDVTEQLIGMTINNELKVAASNALAGDPHPGIPKRLVIDYTINGVARREVLTEGETKIIPN